VRFVVDKTQSAFHATMRVKRDGFCIRKGFETAAMRAKLLYSFLGLRLGHGVQ
jgi:hypothetical protein